MHELLDRRFSLLLCCLCPDPKQAGHAPHTLPHAWLRLPVAVTSTIQLVPTQVSVMCVGACLARRIQLMTLPWLIS
jgi:hypothetical protein